MTKKSTNPVTPQEFELCNVHAKELENMRENLKIHKSEIHDLLDDLRLDLLEYMKPPITKTQAITIMLALVGGITFSVGYVTENRQNIKINTTEIENVKEYQKIENANVNKKLDKIYDVLVDKNKAK